MRTSIKGLIYSIVEATERGSMATDGDEKITEEQKEQLHTWIAAIPFSKPSRNFVRDFADAVLMAELLKVYYPRYVDLHNYVPANNFTTKKENWNILNRKVLSKIDMKLSKDTINQLANYHPGVIEHLLLELRARLLRDPEHQDSLRRISEKEPIVESKNDADAEKERSISCSNDPDQSTPEGSLLKRIKTRLIFIFHWLCLWLRIWQHLPVIWHRGSQGAALSRRQDTSQNTNSEDVVSLQVCTELRQKLRAKDDLISSLNCKVAYLENAMRAQDLRISSLASRILQNAVDSEQLARNQTNAAMAKLRPRSATVREKVKVEE
ncbi:uncharacterized protein LOC117221952 isoform X1 [Megalopta genalis]|uniref:uncharacterized protein LOC117221952 isoform X1 n=2 Tax=Megalopta genalis TaxID=115081 RepID=UPI003FD4027D